MNSPITLRRLEYDPSTVHIFYVSRLFYLKEKKRLVEFVFTSKNHLEVSTIKHFLEESEEPFNTTTRAEYLKGVCK